MQFEWDANKAERNYAKHNIAFEDALLAFYDDFGLHEFNRVVENETRYHVIGAVAVLILFVVYTVRGANEETYRIITARKASARERQRYRQKAFE